MIKFCILHSYPLFCILHSIFYSVYSVFCILNPVFCILLLSVVHPQSRSFERRICAQTQDLQIFKKFNMFQMNPKEVFHNTAYSVQLPYLAGHYL